MNANKNAISNIFNKSRRIEVPFFQRNYVWQEVNWSRFFDDMVNISTGMNNIDYFMGSIILKQVPQNTTARIGDVRVLVDGQQRLTTIIIFFKALADSGISPEYDFQKFKDTFYNHDDKIILYHNMNDKDVFDFIVHEDKTNIMCRKDEFERHNIFKCYLYILEQLNKPDTIIEVWNLLNRMSFVGIDLTSDENEKLIFDTINSLGVKLTTAELIKNYLYSNDEIELYKNTWVNVFEKDDTVIDYWSSLIDTTRGTTNIDLLFFSYYLFEVGHDVTMSKLFNSYKEYIDKNKSNKNNIINNITEYAKLYCENFSEDKLSSGIGENDYIARMNILVFQLGLFTLIPYLLYILKKVSNDSEKRKIFKLIETYVIRRVICGYATQGYNNFFQSFIKDNLNTYDLLKNRLFRNTDNDYYLKAVEDDEFKDKFINNEKLSNNASKVILFLIEISIGQSPYSSTAILPIKSYTLEHVMPIKWFKHWKDIDQTSESNVDYRNGRISRIGNKTIITSKLNTDLKNYDWKTKKDGNKKCKGLNAYASGLATFSDYLKLEEWNEEVIDERTNRLLDNAMEIWTY